MTATIDLTRRPVLDLELRQFETTTNGVHVIGTWYMDEDERKAEPCIALVDASRRLRRGRVIPCIIPLSDAWKWNMQTGDPDYIWPLLRRWVRAGALPGNPMGDRDLWAIFDAVQSRLSDLIAMPPIPAKGAIKHSVAPKETVGIVTIRNESSGEVLQQAEVKANVRD